MEILILEPCVTFAARPQPPEMWIEPATRQACPAVEHDSWIVKKRPTLVVVQTDHTEATRFDELADAPEGASTVAGVMEHAVADDDVEEALLEGGIEQI